jgi:hypothetical protein
MNGPKVFISYSHDSDAPLLRGPTTEPVTSLSFDLVLKRAHPAPDQGGTRETEEKIRAESQAEIRRLIDGFIDAVKENVPDEEARERIRKALLGSMPGDVEEPQ